MAARVRGALKLVTAPTEEVVTLAQVKASLKVEHEDDDDLLEAMIEAVVGHVDGPKGFLGRALAPQTWDYYLDAFPQDACGRDLDTIELPLPPLIEVEGVFYSDSDGVESEFSADSYVADLVGEPGRVVLVSGASWPTLPEGRPNAVRIRFRAGFVAAGVSPEQADVPRPIATAVKLHVGDLYRNRETMTPEKLETLPWAAEQLLRPWRFYLAVA